MPEEFYLSYLFSRPYEIAFLLIDLPITLPRQNQHYRGFLYHFNFILYQGLSQTFLKVTLWVGFNSNLD